MTSSTKAMPTADTLNVGGRIIWSELPDELPELEAVPPTPTPTTTQRPTPKSKLILDTSFQYSTATKGSPKIVTPGDTLHTGRIIWSELPDELPELAEVLSKSAHIVPLEGLQSDDEGSAGLAHNRITVQDEDDETDGESGCTTDSDIEVPELDSGDSELDTDTDEGDEAADQDTLAVRHP
ncbi:hypothetical protein Hypma_008242 [Hypsizygus marmoreus]|uniref:Uncharacterized protein n=1 Tax=Hypsizygus marmoreus TaxID=39966 RepID=A0A369JQV9_HYPMA|nr:hypothetical protein Hypma_008242 [Hypsizygus marmoreus]